MQKIGVFSTYQSAKQKVLSVATYSFSICKLEKEQRVQIHRTDGRFSLEQILHIYTDSTQKHKHGIGFILCQSNKKQNKTPKQYYSIHFRHWGIWVVWCIKVVGLQKDGEVC